MEAIKSPGLDSGFPRFFIKLGTIDTSRKITNRLERTVFITFRNDDFFDQGLTHTFNRGETKANSVFSTNNSEVRIGLINIWTKHFNTHALTFRNLNRQTIGPAHIGSHQRSHEGVWIMCLEVGRPISY